MITHLKIKVLYAVCFLVVTGMKVKILFMWVLSCWAPMNVFMLEIDL